MCVSEPAPYCIFDFAICWHQLRNYWGFKYLTSWDIIFTSFTSPLLSAHTAAVGKNLCYTFVRFSICVCPTICISVGTHSVSTHEINVIDPKRWRKSTAHTHVGDVFFTLQLFICGIICIYTCGQLSLTRPHVNLMHFYTWLLTCVMNVTWKVR